MKNCFIIGALFMACTSLSAQSVEISAFPYNTPGDDLPTSITRHGRKLYLTRDLGHQRIYVSERTPTGWGSPRLVSSSVNDGTEVGGASLQSNGTEMFFSAYEHAAGTAGRTDIYSATKAGERPQVSVLPQGINSEHWDSQPALSADATVLIFASDRPGGAGKSDLYISRKRRGGWTAATPLVGVNSAADEMSPTIAADGKTIFFASDRPGGAGGFDLYTGTLEGGEVRNVKSLGSPINSPGDEYYYVLYPNSTTALFASSRPGGAGELDVYIAAPSPVTARPMVLVEGNVMDADTRRPVGGAKITATDLRTGEAVAEYTADAEDGRYYVVIPAEVAYSLTAEQDGYIFHSEPFNAKASAVPLERTIELYPVANGRTSLLVSFDFDKSDLKSESTPDLERAVELLKKNPSFSVVIEGHTDDVGKADYNDALSLRRAESVKSYLVAGGIASDRVKAVGFGSRQPLIKATTDEARAKNRRVEMILNTR